MRKLTGCLLILALIAAIIGGIGYFAIRAIPGEFEVRSARHRVATPQPPAVISSGGVVSPVTSGRTTSPATSVAAPAVEPPAPSGYELIYYVPMNLVERVIQALFPIEQNFSGLITLTLRNPRFIGDSDPNWLRLTADMETALKEGRRERFPGRVTVRSQLRYDRASRRVQLVNAELVEFAFDGEAAKYAADLQPALAAALAAEAAGYTVFEVPEGQAWLRRGMGFVRDVAIVNGKVALVLGGSEK